MHQKLVLDPFLILVNSPKQSLSCKKFIWKQDILREDYQKALKKLTLFFLWNPVPFNGQNYQKRGLELVTSCSLGYETSSEKFLYQLCNIWPSLMMKYKALFELFQKLHLQIYASQFMTS